MPEFHALAVKVKNWRRILSESQTEFSMNCGLTAKTISNIECEREETKIGTVQKIAAYTGESVSELLNPETITE